MNHNFIKVNENNLDVLIDLRYACQNNFTKEKVFFSEDCFLHEIAFEHLCKSIEISKKVGLRIKIFDAYRPVYVQQKLWDYLPNPDFIAPPKKGSPHSRGVAIDITLVDKNDKELDMGTDFDEFSKLSYHGNNNISAEAYRNRLTLLGIMTDAGWDFFRNEWWHYQLFKSKNYPIVKDLKK